MFRTALLLIWLGLVYHGLGLSVQGSDTGVSVGGIAGRAAGRNREVARAASTESKPISLGDRPAAWSRLPAIAGGTLSLDDFRGQQLLVVVFLCPHCPAAQAYEDRLIQLVQDFQAKSVGFVAINVNDGGKLNEMKQRATEKGYNFPYLLDATQQTAQDYGAHCTPHCFVLNAERALVYRGAIDDSLRPSGVSQQHLRSALEALLAGKQPKVAETEPPGCGILWK